MSTWEIVDVPVPSSLDDDAAWGVRGTTALERSLAEATWGHHDLAYTALDTLVALQDQRYTQRIHLAAVSPERSRDVVGAAFVRLPTRGNTHTAEVDVLVHPEHVRTGLDDGLLRAAEDRVRGLGRTLVILSSEHRGEPPGDEPGVLVAPTGSGRIRRTDAGAELAARAGYALEQAERYSVLPLPVPTERLRALRDEALAVAAVGHEYRVRTWVDRVPDEWLDQLARLETRMSTDAPVAALDVGADPWDADRVRATDDQRTSSCRGALITVAEHVPTRTLAAFTVLEYPFADEEVVYQEDTLVLREHRGRRLGQLVKAVNLERLAEVRPHAVRVHTWNAEENSFMLRINVALGFAPAGVYGVWQKRLL
ncbi:GNAT family N-acetyltransferase [Cellulomonas fimi]|uniref:GNAT family N-acetyltransferase n=1 Tax=Cellulomonas fimi TaxID=1708 RepID=A0A7Y0QHJ9_CELFI|nr:GNAT family N-acetyltransferase [Cellulomonas fimi]NMR21241.1 GNAT family N-acetyltransferase [Cellulomonas fimi]